MARQFRRIPLEIYTFITALIVGVVGWAIDSSISATSEALGSYVPLALVFGFVYVLVSFYIGVKEAVKAGVAFALGIICAGFVVEDLATILSGIISIIVIAIIYVYHGQERACSLRD